MIKGEVAARYLLSLDQNGRYFSKDSLISRNGRKFYEGNARMNKILHLAQNIYYAKNGFLLISDDFYAFDNGAVLLDVREGYSRLLTEGKVDCDIIPEDDRRFLSVIFDIFKDVPIDELIDLDHEDPAWQERRTFFYTKDEKMNTRDYLEDYQKRYGDIIRVMDRMENGYAY